MAEKPWRMFVGLWIDAQTLQVLEQIQRQLKAEQLPVRWTASDKLHITIQFLGDMNPEAVKQLQQHLDFAVQGLRAPLLQLNTLGVFPNLRKPRVVWAGLQSIPEALTVLQRVVIEASSKVGIVPEDRPYHPHVTLGYVQRAAKDFERQRCGAALNIAWDGAVPRYAQDLRLVRSELKASGAVYTPYARWLLS